jgi:hypothetical protein
MNFETTFQQWLSSCLLQPVPSSVKAFSFNLFEYPETPECKFGVELVGAGSFDATDEDWACDEIWEPTVRSIAIPKAFSGANWEDCLAKVELLVIAYLKEAREARVLKNGLGVGVGFVDGNLNVVWQP